ncbi:MAG: glycosyltransferase [Lachnospiraceae bacterium]|nr:glycosyltransferase [Lachnospiraceae bacterium]
MEKGLITIMVPIYNVGKYLEKCIKSIIDQTYKNIELILVNDGSTDNGLEICNKYATMDSRIKVINKENGGLSSARNIALDIARGEFIGFVDGDDYIEKDMFEVLHNLIIDNDADISMCSFYFTSEEKEYSLYDTNKFTILNKEEALKEILLDKRIQSYAWDKLYKKSLFDNVRYPLGKKYEDIGTTFLLLEQIKKMAIIDTPKYHYLQRNDSIVAVKDESNINGFLDMAEFRYNYIIKNYSEIASLANYNMADAICMNFEKICVSKNLELFENEKIKSKLSMLIQLINNYENEIIGFMDNFQKLRLYTILYDMNFYKQIGYDLYLEEKKNTI